ncbi:hypothetical protein BT96DRAFT_837478 [Gymnopus androsaceus JB14]|uniref:Uncharacterized protein n=1 Tax=Gymnopus androsaceus JB14 TaxID=1447944 RepID=A0A6A4GPM5_9AGAR|nr:hypothetical protein BT96DRAFT_837478 [Gymnopus androsaceus JB14]
MLACCCISDEVKLAAIRLYEKNLLPLNDILNCVGFSESTFWCALHLYHTTGHLGFDNVYYLLKLVHYHPEWFLDELCDHA